MIKETNYK